MVVLPCFRHRLTERTERLSPELATLFLLVCCRFDTAFERRASMKAFAVALILSLSLLAHSARRSTQGYIF